MIVSQTKRAAVSVDIFQNTLTLTFANGKDLSVDITKLAAHIQQQAMLHGIKSKLVDAAAIARNLETGKSASVDDKYMAVKEVFDRLTRAENPQWNKGRATGAEDGAGASGPGNTVFIRALIRMTGKDRAAIDAFLAMKTKEERAALRKNPRVLAIMAELQAATVVGGVNTDDLLGELGGAPSALVAVPTDKDEAAEGVREGSEGAETPEAVAQSAPAPAVGKASKAKGKSTAAHA